MMRTWISGLTFAAVAWLSAVGCSSTVVSNGDCPSSAPATGEPCDQIGLSCPYSETDCGPVMRCMPEGTWQDTNDGCVTPVDCLNANDGDFCENVGETCGDIGECGGSQTTCGPDHTWSTIYYDGGCCMGFDCPATPPLNGDPCDPCVDASDCAFTTSCGTTTASCGFDGVWTVTPGECPPPPSDGCDAITDASTCATVPGCRWLTPGCNGPELPAAGCFPAADCAGACADPAKTCQGVIIDPCNGGQTCMECAAIANVCL